jgi:hypothetical protein
VACQYERGYKPFNKLTNQTGDNVNTLQSAVINQLGYTNEDLEEGNEDLIATLRAICSHGIDGGFSGFIYHNETSKFFRENRSIIIESAKDLADDLGGWGAGTEGMLEMIAGFNCISGDYTNDEIDEALWNDDSENVSVQNAMAWFAAEEVARSLEGYCNLRVRWEFISRLHSI